MKYSSFSRRAVAVILDAIVTQVPFLLTFGFDNSAAISALNFFIGVTYFVWMNGMYGATIGKMIMKIKIVKINGKKLSYSDAMVREISSYLSVLVLFLGYFNVLWDRKKQAWHDKIAKTVVVRA